MARTRYIACTRMYNASPAVAALWDEVIRAAARLSGVPLEIVRHPFPADIEDLWQRPDLGLAFICGRAFMLEERKHHPIGVPLRTDAGYENAPLYHTVFLVRDENSCRTLEDTFGKRLGWTVPHSHSGFIAPLRHLQAHAAAGREGLYAELVGPLHTPAMCLAALREKRADVVPLDAYYHALLLRNNPKVLANTRVVAATRACPMPFLAASPELAPEVCDALRRGLMGAAGEPGMGEILEKLRITGFARPDIAAYAQLGDSEPQPLGLFHGLSRREAAARRMTQL